MAGALRIGTRGSALALAQTRQLAGELGKAAKLPTELVTVTTQGDTSNASLASLGGTGVFAGALREALLAGEVDVIVHSLKDLPTAPYPGLVIGAIPRRADARDVLVSRDGLTLDTLLDGSRIGTGSPRRAAQLRAARPELEVVELRGNVDTRIGKVASGALDGVILSAAGLGRLARADEISERFALSEWPTAPGQGALAVEGRAGEKSVALKQGLAAIDHATTHANVVAERAVLAGLEAGCAAPVAASSIIEDGMLFLTATVYATDGSSKLTSSHATVLESTRAADLLVGAAETAQRVVAELLASGAKDLG